MSVQSATPSLDWLTRPPNAAGPTETTAAQRPSVRGRREIWNAALGPCRFHCEKLHVSKLPTKYGLATFVEAPALKENVTAIAVTASTTSGTRARAGISTDHRRKSSKAHPPKEGVAPGVSCRWTSSRIAGVAATGQRVRRG